MEEPPEPSYQQAMHRKYDRLRQRGRQTTNLLFVASLLFIAAFVLFLIPPSGIAYLLATLGAILCVLVAIVLGLRARIIEAQAKKQVDAYQVALNLPRLEEVSRQEDTWAEHILRWAFPVLTGLAFLIIFGELAVLWQEQSAIHPQLLLLGVMVFTAATGVGGMWLTSPSKHQKRNKES